MATRCDPVTGSDTVYVNQVRGDTFHLMVELADGNRNPVDVTGWTWRCDLADAAGVVAAVDVDTADAVIGVLQLAMTAATTAGLALGDYAFDLEATDPTPNTRTLVAGRVRVREDVTQ